MIFGHQFYHQSLRKYIVMFGNMFNDMIVQRLDKNSNVVQSIGVPLAYSPKEKFLVRLSADPNLDRPIAVQLPAMAFELVGMNYDGTRRLSSVIKNVAVSGTNVSQQYTPVPWNLNFALYLFVRNADDGAQLLEQILPFFGPEWTHSVNLIPSMNIVMDIPTILNDVSTEDTYEGDFMTRRAMVYTLNFTVKAYFFGPVRGPRSGENLIRRVQVDIGVPKAANVYSSLSFEITDEEVERTGRSSRIVITPGLLANGSPTTNSAASISTSLISANSNYGLAVNTFFFTDGKKYDPKSGTDL